MKLRLATLFIAALPLALIISSACGDDGADEITLWDYFQQLDFAIEAGVGEVERGRTEDTGSIEATQTEEEIADNLQNFIATIDELGQQHMANLESIEPPAPVRQAHDEYVAIEREGLALWGSMNDRAQRTSSLDELVEILDEAEGPAFADLTKREDEACLALQAIADDNGINVDLECLE